MAPDAIYIYIYKAVQIHSWEVLGGKGFKLSRSGTVRGFTFPRNAWKLIWKHRWPQVLALRRAPRAYSFGRSLRTSKCKKNVNVQTSYLSTDWAMQPAKEGGSCDTCIYLSIYRYIYIVL